MMATIHKSFYSLLDKDDQMVTKCLHFFFLLYRLRTGILYRCLDNIDPQKKLFVFQSLEGRVLCAYGTYCLIFLL